MPQNDFKPFAAQSGANVVTQAAYAAAPELGSGFSAGISSSAKFNKVWRQSSIISAVVAQAIADVLGVNIIDDGTTATIEANFIQLLRSGGSYLIDNGTANTLVATMTPAPTTLGNVVGMPIYLKVKTTNTGATTLNLNSFGGIAVTTNALAGLSASALTANGITTLMYDGTQFQIL
jgi:hypothetical protein